jgi:hypothetical protein
MIDFFTFTTVSLLWNVGNGEDIVPRTYRAATARRLRSLPCSLPGLRSFLACSSCAGALVIRITISATDLELISRSVAMVASNFFWALLH